VVGVHVFDEDVEHPGGRSQCRDVAQAVVRGGAVQPDGLAIQRNLPMDDLARVVAVDPARGETEGVDQEVVGRRDVGVHQDRDDALGCRGHGGTLGLRAGEVLKETDWRIKLAEMLAGSVVSRPSVAATAPGVPRERGELPSHVRLVGVATQRRHLRECQVRAGQQPGARA
jgi:hypothetical protein